MNIRTLSPSSAVRCPIRSDCGPPFGVPILIKVIPLLGRRIKWLGTLSQDGDMNPSVTLLCCSILVMSPRLTRPLSKKPTCPPSCSPYYPSANGALGPVTETFAKYTKAPTIDPWTATEYTTPRLGMYPTNFLKCLQEPTCTRSRKNLRNANRKHGV